MWIRPLKKRVPQCSAFINARNFIANDSTHVTTGLDLDLPLSHSDLHSAYSDYGHRYSLGVITWCGRPTDRPMQCITMSGCHSIALHCSIWLKAPLGINMQYITATMTTTTTCHTPLHQLAVQHAVQHFRSWHYLLYIIFVGDVVYNIYV